MIPVWGWLLIVFGSCTVTGLATAAYIFIYIGKGLWG